MSLLNKIIAIIIALGTLIGGAIAYDAKKADQSEVDLLSERLEQKIVIDRIYNLQRRIWDLEDRYDGVGIPNAPIEVKKEYRELKQELEILKTKKDKS